MIEANVSRRRNEWGEWVVRVWVDGVRRPEADYMTEDRDDAEATARAMVAPPVQLPGEQRTDDRPIY